MTSKVFLASLLFPCCGVLAQNSTPAGAESLPELPSTQSQPSFDPGNERQDLTPSTSLPTEQTRPNRRMPTAEELEQVRKDRNWMVEGMKEKEAERKNTTLQDASNTDMSQSIIDMVLQKNKNKKTAPETNKNPRRDDRAQTEQNKNPAAKKKESISTFRPSIDSNAFDTQFSSEKRNEAALPQSILEKERNAAISAGFYDPNPMKKDPLANPFSNLPIPEEALPRSQPQSPTWTDNRTNAAAAANTQGSPNGTAAPNSNPFLSNNASGAFSNGGNSSNSLNPNSPPVLVTSDPGPSGPRMAVEQPYTVLREQELVRQLQQQKSIRPKSQDLRNSIPDPGEARLF